MNEQTIFRVSGLNRAYTKISNVLLADATISFACKGFLVSILRLPLDWTFNVKWLRKEYGISKDTAYALVKEAIGRGYCKREWTKGGATDYLFSDDPQELASTSSPSPDHFPEKPESGVPANPVSGNSGHIQRTNTKNKEIIERESALSVSFELEADWSLPAEWHAWATKESPEHAHLVDNEAKKFRAHWRGKQRKCAEAAWEAEWQKWFLRTCERPAAPHSAHGAYSVSAAMDTIGGSPRDTGESIPLMVARSIVAGTYKGPILPKYRADVDRLVAELSKGAA
jgi:predicted DNA-binding transcriptional regulator